MICISLSPYVLRLRLNTFFCREHTYGTVKYTK